MKIEGFHCWCQSLYHQKHHRSEEFIWGREECAIRFHFKSALFECILEYRSGWDTLSSFSKRMKATEVLRRSELDWIQPPISLKLCNDGKSYTNSVTEWKPKPHNWERMLGTTRLPLCKVFACKKSSDQAMTQKRNSVAFVVKWIRTKVKLSENIKWAMICPLSPGTLIVMA